MSISEGLNVRFPESRRSECVCWNRAERLLLAESSHWLTVNMRTAAFLGEESMRFKNLFFDLWYRFGKPPWIIGQAQPDLIAAAEKGDRKSVV